MVKLINKCGHVIDYNLIEEIETEFALKVINEQTLNRVLIPGECNKPDNPPVALMVADNIDNLECTISGAGYFPPGEFHPFPETRAPRGGGRQFWWRGA